MKRWPLFLGSLIIVLTAQAQNFELVDKQESYQAGFSQLVKVSLKIKNNTDKSQFYVIRKVRSDLSESQKGYFCLDKDSSEEKMIFNRTVTLKDTWAKEQKK